MTELTPSSLIAPANLSVEGYLLHLQGHVILGLAARIGLARPGDKQALLEELLVASDQALATLTAVPQHRHPPLVDIFGCQIPLARHKPRADHDAATPVLLGPTREQRVAVIVGHICSGKDTIAKLLCAQTNGILAGYSQVLRPVMAVTGVRSAQRSEYQRTGDAMRETFGADILSLLILNMLQRQERLIVCVGPRFAAEVFALSGGTVIGIHTAPGDGNDDADTRFLRYAGRQREGDGLLRRQFLARDAEEGATVRAIFASGLVHHWVCNDVDLSGEELQRRVASIGARLVHG